MADYVIDWATADAEGANVITGSGDPITATVTTPANIATGGTGGEFSYYAARDGLRSYYPDPDDPAEIGITFTDGVGDPIGVSNVTFDILDVDSNGSNWDDLVEIFAYDLNGVRLDVTFSNYTDQTVTAYSIEGESNDPNNTPLTVTIAGPVASFRIVFDNGPDDNNAGQITVTDISFDEPIVVCFVRGTMIETDRGEIAVEALMADDLVRTADNGFQPIRWIGSETVKAKGNMAPILFRKGAIGNTRDLLLSPAHRVMLQDWQTQVLFGTGELLASAKSLVNDSTILRQESGEQVEYFHILFDKHEIIFSDGAATESFHPGDAVSGTMAQQARNEIHELFPELANKERSYGPSVRETLRPHEVALLNI